MVVERYHTGTALELTKHRIEELLKGSNELVNGYLQHFNGRWGKLLRPRLVLAFAELGDKQSIPSAVNCAACCELLHTASLVHDDVIDEADTRRGNPTLNNLYGNSIAVIVGDYMLAVVLKAINEENDCRLTDMMLETSQELGLGVLNEILNRDNLQMSVDKYYDIIHFKTATLFGLCCAMGAYVGGLPAAEVKLAREYGQQLGMGFQVVDDLLDICADQSATGKPVFNDLREGRITLPLIHAMGEDPGATKRLVGEFQDNGHDNQAGLRIREHLYNLGSLFYARRDAVRFLGRARELSKQLNGCEERLVQVWELEAIEEKVIQSIPVPDCGAADNA